MAQMFLSYYLAPLQRFMCCELTWQCGSKVLGVDKALKRHRLVGVLRSTGGPPLQQIHAFLVGPGQFLGENGCKSETWPFLLSGFLSQDILCPSCTCSHHYLHQVVTQCAVSTQILQTCEPNFFFVSSRLNISVGKHKTNISGL